MRLAPRCASNYINGRASVLGAIRSEGDPLCASFVTVSLQRPRLPLPPLLRRQRSHTAPGYGMMGGGYGPGYGPGMMGGGYGPGYGPGMMGPGYGPVTATAMGRA